MTAHRFFLLGPLEVLADGRPLLNPPTVKSQGLLAYLLLHRGRSSSRERLAGLFWGDRTERKARRSLSTALWHLRSCLGDDLILSDHTTVEIDPVADLWIDVDEFETLARRGDRASLDAAVTLYRGELLPELYDDWVIDRRYRLEALYLGALARLMQLLEEADAPAAALTTAQRLLAVDPLREEAHRTVMRAHCRLGDRDAALAHYHYVERIIDQEMGAAPVGETRHLYRAIRDGEMPVAAAPGTPVTAPELPPTRGHNPLAPALIPPLVGRDPALARLHGHWEAALAGRGSLALVGGEAGVGKTRLLDEYARRLHRQGIWTVTGRCYTFERLLSYQPMVEVLTSLQQLVPVDEWDALPAWVLTSLDRLLPGLPSGDPASDAVPPADLEGEGERLFESVTRLLITVSAHRPLLIILEDLQWAGESTLGLIHHLARRLVGHPILLVGSHRPVSAQLDHPLRVLRDELVREGIAWAWHLDPLCEADVLALVDQMSGAGAAAVPLARRLYRETEGNPFYLSEIVKALFESQQLQMDGVHWAGEWEWLGEARLPLPSTVREAILARVGRLGEDDRRGIRLAAVLGREFDLAPFCHLCEGDKEAALATLETLLRRRLITEGTGLAGRDYAFTHHKIQEVVYETLPRHAQQRLHALAGRALEAGYRVADETLQEVTGVSDHILPAELAYHFAIGRAIDPTLNTAAIHYLLAAGDAARRLYAHQEAVHFYRQALAILREENEFEGMARTLVKLGLVHHNAFDFARARETYEQAFAYWHHAQAAPLPGPSVPVPHPLRVATEQILQLDPAGHADTETGRVLAAIFSGLVRQGPQLEALPDVAERWEILEDGRRYVFQLHSDALWSDGVPVTAPDFVCAWQRVLDPPTPDDIASRLFDIRGARDFHGGSGQPELLGLQAPDEGTLVVDLEAPCGYFLQLMADVITLPVPAHCVARFGAGWADPTRLVTNGPFRLRSWDRHESMVLERNPAYHGRVGGNLDRMVLHFSRSWSDFLEMYGADKLDLLEITYLHPPDLDAARQRYAGDYRCLSRLATGYTGFDTRRSPFDDPRVRRAFALATDRAGIARLLGGDQVFPATGGFIPPGMPGHTPAIGLPFDPPAARRLLAEAGYPDGRGFPPVTSILPGVPGSEPVRAFVTGRWKEILGISITGESISFDRIRATIENRGAHLFSEALRADFPDPAAFLQDSQPLLDTGWHHDRYESLVARARRSSDQVERMHLYREADRILMAEAPLIPLFYMRTHLLVKPWVRGFPGGGSDRYTWADLTIEPHP